MMDATVPFATARDRPHPHPLAYEIGRRAAERQVKAEHLLNAAPVS